MRVEEKRRLNLRLDADLIENAREYAAQHKTSISHLVEDFLRQLAMENGSSFYGTAGDMPGTGARGEYIPTTLLVQELTGLISNGASIEEYHNYLVEKYGR